MDNAKGCILAYDSEDHLVAGKKLLDWLTTRSDFDAKQQFMEVGHKMFIRCFFGSLSYTSEELVEFLDTLQWTKPYGIRYFF